MPRLRLLLFGLVILIAGGGLLTTAFMVRAKTRAQADWLVAKNLALAPAVKGLTEPTFVAGPPDGTRRLFMLERAGRVRVADSNGQLRPGPFLDVSANTSTGTEEGLLGLAFDPSFAQNGYVYIDYTSSDANVQVVRYTVSTNQPDQADPASAQTVMTITKQSKYHNGGMLAFGPDGYLYISIGDDEASDQAQNLGSLYGKILRVDVESAQPYAIPGTNPFVNRAGARGEIWSYGLRNPWRFSFDRLTGDMWIADVGDAKWEEVDFQPAGSQGGENYGWPMNEGNECVDPDHCHDAGLVAPVVTYGHNMTCAIMGGYVYRGPTAVGLTGRYLYGDYCAGGVFTLSDQPNLVGKRIELGYQSIKIDSFGEDPAGDVYVVDEQGGVIYRIMDGSLPG